MVVGSSALFGGVMSAKKDQKATAATRLKNQLLRKYDSAYQNRSCESVRRLGNEKSSKHSTGIPTTRLQFSEIPSHHRFHNNPTQTTIFLASQAGKSGESKTSSQDFFCRTSKLSHACGRRGRCAAAAVTDIGVALWRLVRQRASPHTEQASQSACAPSRKPTSQALNQLRQQTNTEFARLT